MSLPAFYFAARQRPSHLAARDNSRVLPLLPGVVLIRQAAAAGTVTGAEGVIFRGKEDALFDVVAGGQPLEGAGAVETTVEAVSAMPAERARRC
jgi:hypothetical protein